MAHRLIIVGALLLLALAVSFIQSFIGMKRN